MKTLAAAAILVAATAHAAAPAPAHGPFAPCEALYVEVVFDGAVDYGRVAVHPQRAACADALAQATPPVPKAPGSVAFWADAYNLLTMLAIAAEPQRWSAQQDGKALFRDRKFAIAGEQLTLDQIEHDRLAASTHDPRVEFLLSCGARTCGLLPPRLLTDRTRTAASIKEAEITGSMVEGMRRWFARPDNLRVTRDRGVVEIGQLLQLDWHGGDFERAGTSLVELVASALEERSPPDADAAKDLRAGRLKLAVRPYDWRVNRVRRVFLLP